MSDKNIKKTIGLYPNRKYTWKKQHPDLRDFKFARSPMADKLKIEELPKTVNLRRWCSQVEDQGQLGSCTAHAWSGLLEYNANREKKIPYRDLSRLFIYYNERRIEGTIDQDSGAELRDGAKAIATYGACPEQWCQYKINAFKNKPSDKAFQEALSRKITNYYALNTFDELKISLAEGHPFVFGFYVYESFESDQVAKTGVVSMPDVKNEKLLGGHAVLAIGYNEPQKRFLCRNSWGKGWGLKGTLDGYFTMPYEYIANSDLATDFWTCVI